MGTPSSASTKESDVASGSSLALFNEFLLIRSFGQLCRHLDVPWRKLNYLLYVLRSANRYQSFDIAKKSGGLRKIKSPIKPLKEIQKKIALELAKIYRAPLNVYGYVPDRGVTHKAANHVGQRWVARIDLADFFGTINFGRVRGLFMGKPFFFPEPVATVLAQICIDENGLPQGAPTSPVISNIVFWKLDARLRRLAREHRCVYTRYADDLVFSTNKARMSAGICFLSESGGPHAVTVGESLRREIEAEGFTISDSKTRLFGRSVRQQVTGLTVNQKINLAPKYERELRAVLYACQKVGPELASERFFSAHYKRNVPVRKQAPELFDVIRGRIQYFGRIKGYGSNAYLRLAQKFAKFDSTFEIRTQPVVPRVFVFTEGVTDYLHLEAMLRRLQVLGEFKGLSIHWDDHGKREATGESKLLQMCDTYAKGPKRDGLFVFLFDRDKQDIVSKVESMDGSPKRWGNDVLSLCLPVPAHRDPSIPFCVEHLYSDEFLYQKNQEGRRLFARREFLQDGFHIEEDIYCKNLKSSLIVDSDVVLSSGARRGQSVALSKKAFATYVSRGVPPFDLPDLSGFRPLFEVLTQLVETHEVLHAMPEAVPPTALNHSMT